VNRLLSRTCGIETLSAHGASLLQKMLLKQENSLLIRCILV
jgi:hypothetical protein